MKQKRNYRNYIIPIVITLVILSIGVLATTIRDDYISQGNYTLNNTGSFYNGAKTSVRTADVVVCRGNNIIDDQLKRFTCDVVCASTDSDCSQELSSSIESNKIIKWIGTFNVSNAVTNTPYNYLLAIKSKGNITLDAQNSILISSFSSTLAQNTMGLLIQDSNNIHINGLEITSNQVCGSGKACGGLAVMDSNYIYLDEIKVSKVNGFQYIFSSYAGSGTQSVYLTNSIGLGEGIADTIGGGTLSNGKLLDNVNIVNCHLTQTSSLGTYYNTIDIVNSTNLKVLNNFIKGHLVIGVEDGGSSDALIMGNTVIPVDGEKNSIVASYNESSRRISFINNNVKGYLLLSGNNNKVIGNTFDSNNMTSTIYGLENLIENNYFLMNFTTTNPYSFYTTPNAIRNKITNNYFYTSGINLDGNYNSFSNNYITNLTYGGFTTGITCIGLGNIIDNNKLIVSSGSNMNYGILGGDGCQYSSISGNVMENNGGVNDFIVMSGANSILLNNRLLLSDPSDAIIKNNSNFGSNNIISDDFTYTNYPTCDAIGTSTGKTLHNSTTSCTCIGGAWKCWVMS